MRPFQFLVVLHPTEKGKEIGESSKIIVTPQTVLAADESGAAMLAGRAIPEEHLDKLERIQVYVRPF